MDLTQIPRAEPFGPGGIELTPATQLDTM